jgi:hypothetical protein
MKGEIDMALIFPKEMVIAAYKTVAEKGLMDKDLLIVKLQNLVTNGDLTEQDVEPIVDILVPQE